MLFRSVREQVPAAVLLDVVMPGRDGFALCAQWRADPNFRTLPVILVTGLDDTAAVERAFAVQASDFITKPVLWALLPHRLRFVLRSHRMQEELRTAVIEAGVASRAKTAFLANMSHELRTPLNAIIGFSEIMRDEVFGPVGNKRYRDYATDIHDSGAHLLGIVNDILDLVKVETGALTLVESEVSISAIVERALRLVESTAKKRSIAIVQKIPADSPMVFVDERRVAQILVNLMVNAVKFSPEGSSIEVRYDAIGNDAGALVVSDNGPGIPKSELHRVMQPFQQLDGSLARSHDGAGLGIPIAMALARLHGAELIYDTDVGRGTTVRLELPRERFISGPDTALRRAG